MLSFFVGALLAKTANVQVVTKGGQFYGALWWFRRGFDRL